MTGSVPPGVVLIAGALLVPLVRGRVRQALMLLLPVASAVAMLQLAHGTFGRAHVFDFALTLVRVDALSLVFGIVFHIAAFIGAIYALQVDDAGQHCAALVYAGAAIAAVFAGDLVTLFVFWEIAGVASTFLIWAARTERSTRSGLRYLAWQVASGVALLAGVVVLAGKTGSIAFDRIGAESLGGKLILLAVAIKCAFPLLHNWLTDAYAEATPTGTVFLSAFTTKLGVYALARGFAGTHELVWIGAAMTAFPIFYAVIENDLRRVLGYSMINQLGFMVVGVGVGTPMAVNGAVAHAFADILFKGLLFMSMGAVLLRAGTAKGSELGGLYKSMPWTTVCCIVGASSISAFPLFSAFVTKSLVLEAVAAGHLTFVWFVLLFASAGVFHHAGIKVPFFAFFAHDRGIRCAEAPWNMRIAMGLAAALCVGIGCRPDALYGLLPHQVAYAPYTTTHVVAQLQLLLFSALAFATLLRTGLYPPETKSVNVDVEWVWRRAGPLAWRHAIVPALDALARLQAAVVERAARLLGPGEKPPKAWPVSTAVLAAVAALLVYLVVDFWVASSGRS